MLGRLSQLPPREQVGLAVACAALLLLAADHFVVKPVAWDLKRMDINIKRAEKLVKDNSKVLQYKDSVESQYAQVKNLIGVSSSEQEGMDFKGDIDDLAPRNGISVKSRKLLPMVPNDFLETYFVSIGEFESEVVALINFLNEIHNAPGLLRVQRLSVSSQTMDNMVKGSLVISKAMTLADEQE